ncbi:MAG: formylmethanofuran dehydrogenase subunit C [Hyphomicrobium sp.]|nr:formylmethanofuran dehydrogenase subunit C [Hyphomicrobium sp.]
MSGQNLQNGLTFRLKAPATERLDLSGVSPAKLANLSSYDIASMKVGMGRHALTLGDAFDISGSNGDTITIEGSGASLDFAGAGLCSGTLRIIGNVGTYAGRKMTGGKLEIRGHAGSYLASGMTGGLIHVSGNASDNLGGILSGDRFGMAGGTVVVEGNIGARAGDKMRRGTIVVRGQTGEGAGTRMIGGTIWAEGGFGPAPGYMMRRGTLIGSKVERLLPTFVDCGRHDLVIVRVLGRYLKATLGDLAPKPMPLFVQKIAGDMATIGKGEILLPAG